MSRLEIFVDVLDLENSDTTYFYFKLCTRISVSQRSAEQGRIVLRYKHDQRLRQTAVTGARDDVLAHYWALSPSDRYKCHRICLVHNACP